MTMNKSAQNFILFLWICFVFFLVTIPDVQCQLEVQVKRESQCSRGLLQDLDNFRVEVTFHANAPQVTNNSLMVFSRHSSNSTPSTECVISLTDHCMPNKSVLDCYCNKIGDDYIVTMRRKAMPVYSLATINITWFQVSNATVLPEMFDVNSEKAATLENIQSQNGPECQISIAQAKPMTFCCKNTVEPCLASINVNNTVVAIGIPCAYYSKVEVGRYTFSHTICGVQSNQIFTCDAVIPGQPEGSSDEIIVVACLLGVLVLLLIVACIVGYCFCKKKKVQCSYTLLHCISIQEEDTGNRNEVHDEKEPLKNENEMRPHENGANSKPISETVHLINEQEMRPDGNGVTNEANPGILSQDESVLLKNEQEMRPDGNGAVNEANPGTLDHTETEYLKSQHEMRPDGNGAVNEANPGTLSQDESVLLKNVQEMRPDGIVAVNEANPDTLSHSAENLDITNVDLQIERQKEEIHNENDLSIQVKEQSAAKTTHDHPFA